MATLEQIRERVESLSQRHSDVTNRRSKLAGQLDSKREELIRLKKEIEAAGFDPKKLKAERDQLEAEVLSLCDTFEKNLSRVEEAVDQYEK